VESSLGGQVGARERNHTQQEGRSWGGARGESAVRCPAPAATRKACDPPSHPVKLKVNAHVAPGWWIAHAPPKQPKQEIVIALPVAAATHSSHQSMPFAGAGPTAAWLLVLQSRHLPGCEALQWLAVSAGLCLHLRSDTRAKHNRGFCVRVFLGWLMHPIVPDNHPCVVLLCVAGGIDPTMCLPFLPPSPHLQVPGAAELNNVVHTWLLPLQADLQPNVKGSGYVKHLRYAPMQHLNWIVWAAWHPG
jgi:hypothetical protein